MAECAHELHPMYEPNCPECNPEGYADLVKGAPRGQAQPPEQTVRAQGRTPMGQGYSDTY